MKYFKKGNILKSFYDITRQGTVFKNYNETAYQYTNLHVVDDILSTGFVHASEIYFLNDTDEYKIGYKALYKKMHGKTISEDYLKNEFGFFSISFTEKKDDIPQYMIYSGEIGVSIGYDFGFEKWGSFYYFNSDYNIEMLKPMIACGKSGKDDIFGFFISVPKYVEYCDKTRATKVINAIYDNFIKESKEINEQLYESQTAYVIPCFIKNKDFISEKEVRITVVACEDKIDSFNKESFGYRKENVLKTKIEFLKSKNKWLKPYISVFYADGNKNIGWPIKEIWVGPGKDQNRAFESLKMRLEYGKLVMFPLPLTEFMARLIVYYKYMTDFLNESYRINIDFDKFIRSVFSKYNNKTEIDEVIQYVRTELQEFQGINLYEVIESKKVKILIGQEIDEKYYKDRRIKEPKQINDYNIDAFSKAEKIYEKIKQAYLEVLKEQAEEIEKRKILGVIKKTKVKIQIKEDVKQKEAQQLFEEYERNHYFSSVGIVLHKSGRSLAH